MKPSHGRSRVVIEEIKPQVDAGRHPLRRIVNDEVLVTAAIFGDGHDHVGARLLYRRVTERRWRFTPMLASGNDLWTGSFKVDKLGSWRFAVLGWIDHFDTWKSDLKKRLAAQPLPSGTPAAGAMPDADLTSDAGLNVGGNGSPNGTSQDIPLALRSGAILLKQAAARARGADAKRLAEAARSLNELADQNLAWYENPLGENIARFWSASSF